MYVLLFMKNKSTSYTVNFEMPRGGVLSILGKLLCVLSSLNSDRFTTNSFMNNHPREPFCKALLVQKQTKTFQCLNQFCPYNIITKIFLYAFIFYLTVLCQLHLSDTVIKTLLRLFCCGEFHSFSCLTKMYQIKKTRSRCILQLIYLTHNASANIFNLLPTFEL